MKQKYTYKDWKRFIDLSYKNKLLWTEQLILYALKSNDRPVINLSWGKDSVIMLHLIRKYCKNTFVIFANTLCEYPETYKYRDLMLKGYFKDINYFETRPYKNMTFRKCVNKYGFPTSRKEGGKGSNSPKCCYYLKEKPLDNKIKELKIDVSFLGLQTTESMNRRRLFMRLGAYYYAKTRALNVCLPLAIWTDKDILRYVKENNIPLNPLYKQMKRTGCMFCSGFKNWRGVMAKYNKKMYAKILLEKDGQRILEDCNYF